MARRQGQIVPRGEKRWLVRWPLGEDEHGRYRCRSKVIKGSKRDAQRFLTEQLHRLDSGSYVEPSRRTLGKYLSDWLDTSAKLKLEARTLEGYRALVKLYIVPELGLRRLDQIKPMDVQAWINGLTERGLSGTTIRKAHAVLGSALKEGVRLGVLLTNPAAYVVLPKQVRSKARPLSPEEVAEFRKKAKGDRFEVLFDFLLATGCRPGEALAVRWADLDLEAGRVTINQALSKAEGKRYFKAPKSKSRRSIPLPAPFVASLRRHRKDQAERVLKGKYYNRDLDLVFANEIGEPLDDRNVDQRHFKPILEAAELPAIRLYDLRHTTATVLMASGTNAKVAAERLGHANVRMTLDTYSHVSPGMQEEATRKLEQLLFAR